MTQVRFDQIPAVCQQLLARHRFEDALKVLITFVEHGAPHYPALSHVLVRAQELGRGKTVESVLEAVRQRFPEDARTWELDVRVQQSRNAWQAMLEALDRLDASGGDPSRTSLWRARALYRLSRGETALRVLDEMSPVAVERGEYMHQRAAVLLQLNRPEDAVTLLRGYLSEPDENLFAAACWKLLGKALDRLGSFDEAFRAFDAGNVQTKKLSGMSFEDNPLRRRVAAFRQLVTREWAKTWSKDPESPGVAESPVFLVGFPRSGTTLMEQVLDAHPGVVALEEKPLVDAVWDRVVGTLHEGGHSEGLDAVARQRSMLEALAGLEPAMLAGFRRAYFDALQGYQKWPDGRVLVDKLPLNMGSLPLIVRLFPNARFIVALRHPCDCILSNYMQDFSLNPGMHMMLDLEWAGWLYRELFELLFQCQDALALKEQVHFLRYEALVTDFDGEVGRLLDFVGLDWDPAVKSYHQHARRRGTLGTPSMEGVTRQLYSSAVDRWTHYADHLSILQPFISGMAARLSYSLEGLPTAGPPDSGAASVGLYKNATKTDGSGG